MNDFKEIPGSNKRYFASKDGTIISLCRGSKKILKKHINRYGYETVAISIVRCKDKYKLVHRLIAMTFLNNYSESLPVNHIDGNKRNNHIDNLEMCTFSENTKHAYRIGLMSAVGENNGQAKLTEKEIYEIRDLIKNKVLTNSQISKKYNISQSTVCDIKFKRSWTHLEDFVNVKEVKRNNSPI